jgi:hypothetical protein
MSTEHAQQVQFAEAFQFADFGRRPTLTSIEGAEMLRLFPMLGERADRAQPVEVHA